MVRRIADLPVHLQAAVASDQPAFLLCIDDIDHDEGAAQLLDVFPGLPRADLPDGEGWAVQFKRMSTNAGPHMAAPYHYRSRMDDGTPAKTIDSIPLDWCFGPGVKLDLRLFPDGHVVGPNEIDAELARIGHRLQSGDIVLVNTAAGSRYGEQDYIDRGCGIGRAATLHLTRQGERPVGTDDWSWGARFHFTCERFARTGDP